MAAAGDPPAEDTPPESVPEPKPQLRPTLRDFYENPEVPVASGDPRSRRQAGILARALGPATPGARPAVIADVGCGDGTAAAVAARVLDAQRPGAQRIVAVDWSHDALRRAAEAAKNAPKGTPVTVVRGELTALPLATGSADAVLFSEVIEHLVDPDAALDELRRVLKPGGHLMLSTPNLAAWYNRALLLTGTQPVFSEVSLRGIHGRPGKQVVGHLRLYTARALRGFLEAAGFEHISLSGAPYHDVPKPLRPIDRMACRAPSLASILLAHARRRRED
ncbi:class I SAM-dependent methyltransferase [Streptomyces sp. A7024]|uniref:Class I SAM-dependent methyltransferase n=1 Tax=Streptomyces coryli TaxID=1128680 RepID=A0A6G4U9P2_9ACTN|nr:class I SAM-dependent methyltransferase [Streptomyces coryli]NGN68843.1 class I SAM-dependent methyltransferase [Streptomyces coryli]